MFFFQLQEELRSIIQSTYPRVNLKNIPLSLVRPPDPKNASGKNFGNLATSCFDLAKIIKENPEKIAEKIALQFENSPFKNWIKKIKQEKAYLNLEIDFTLLGTKLCTQIEEKKDYGKNNIGKGKKILIEFSSPNTNKPMHLGHARNNAIGFSLAKIFQYSGYQVTKVNLINDRGIHICQSMLAYDLFGKNKTPEEEKKKGDHFVGDYYVLFHQQKNESLLEKAQDYLKKWEEKNTKIYSLWEKMNRWVLQGLKETYTRCGIEFDKFYFESETYKLGKKEVENALKNNLCEKNEEGAILINLEKEKLGKKILLRKDGTAVYITQDIWTTIKKFQDYNPEKCLFVVGSEQNLHFKTLFAVLKKFGYFWAQNCTHISYGMIFLPDGKMKSREGKIIDLDNFLDEIKNLALKGLKKRDRKNAL